MGSDRAPAGRPLPRPFADQLRVVGGASAGGGRDGGAETPGDAPGGPVAAANAFAPLLGAAESATPGRVGGPAGGPGASGEFAQGVADLGPIGRPGAAAADQAGGGAAAVDLSRTNELLQQLLDEVRKGRQTFLPVGDRNNTSSGY